MVKCEMCEEPFEYNAVVQIQNTDGSLSQTVETTVVLAANEAQDDLEPHFFHRNLCAAEWSRVNNLRLTRPTSWPSRYYEAIEEETDPEHMGEVLDKLSAQQNKTLPKSRLA